MPSNPMQSRDAFREAAQRLSRACARHDITISKPTALDLLSSVFEVADWNTMSALLKARETTGQDSLPPAQGSTWPAQSANAPPHLGRSMQDMETRRAHFLTRYAQSTQGFVPWDAERPELFGERVTAENIDDFLLWLSDVHGGTSDVVIQTGQHVFANLDGVLIAVTTQTMPHLVVEELLYMMDGENARWMVVHKGQSLLFSYGFRARKPINGHRFKSMAKVCADCVRAPGTRGILLSLKVKTLVPLELEALDVEPDVTNAFLDSVDNRRGLTLFVGITSSGKSTLVSGLVRKQMRGSKPTKIIEYSNPIDYVYDGVYSPASIIQQSYSEAGVGDNIANALRRAPDLIIMGEVRSGDDMEACINAVRSGHAMVVEQAARGVIPALRARIKAGSMSTLSPYEFVTNLNMVVAQVLVPRVGGGQIALREFMVLDNMAWPAEELFSGMDLATYLEAAMRDAENPATLPAMVRAAQTFAMAAKKALEAGLITAETALFVCKSTV